MSPAEQKCQAFVFTFRPCPAAQPKAIKRRLSRLRLGGGGGVTDGVSCGRGRTFFEEERQKADLCRSSRGTSRHVFPGTCHSQHAGCWVVCFLFFLCVCVVSVCTLLCCVFSLAGQKSTHNSVCSLWEYLSVFVHTRAEGCLLLIEAFSFPR